MNIRSVLVSATFATALLSTTTFVNVAYAQKGQVLTPTTDWAVTRVGENSADSYCALARRFVRNTILTIAKNTDEETSFAIDFQRPKFDTNNDLYVVLDPGAGEQRAYDVKPISNNAFVVRLGRDDTFFDALDRTGFLRIEVGMQSYSFNLSDIDAGHATLNTCVSAMEGRYASNNTQQQHGQHNDGHSVNALEDQIQSLRSEIANLANSLGNKEVASASSAPVTQAVTPSVDVQSLLSVNVQEEYSAPAPMPTVKPVSVSAADILAADNVARIMPAGGVAQTQSEQSTEGILAARALERENIALKKTLNNQKKQAVLVQDLKSQVSYLEEEKARLEDVVVNAENSLASERQAVASMKAMLEQKDDGEEIVAELGQRLEALRQEKAQMAQRLISFEQEQGSLKTVLAEKEVVLELERERNAQLMAKQEGKTGTLATLNQELEQLRSEKLTFAQQLLSVKEEKSKVSGQLEIALSEKAEVETQIKADQSKYAQWLVEHEATQVALTDLKAKNTSLKEQIIALNTDESGALYQAKIAKLSEEKAELAQRLISYGQKEEKLSLALNDALSENKKLRGGLDEMQERFEQAMSRMEAAVQKTAAQQPVLPAAPVLTPMSKHSKISMPVIEDNTKPQPKPKRIAAVVKAKKQTVSNIKDVMEAIAPTASPDTRIPLRAVEESSRVQKQKEEFVRLAQANIQQNDAAQIPEAQRLERELARELTGRGNLNAVQQPAIVEEVLDDMSREEEFRSNAQSIARVENTSSVPTYSIENMLNAARLSTNSGVKQVADARQGKAVYQWETGVLYGTSEHVPLQSNQQFDRYVQSYIATTQSRCPGEFAVMPDTTMQNGETRLDSYEMACVGSAVNSSASLLFFNEAGTFTVVAHETTADNLDDAMRVRDQLMRTITGS